LLEVPSMGTVTVEQSPGSLEPIDLPSKWRLVKLSMASESQSSFPITLFEPLLAVLAGTYLRTALHLFGAGDSIGVAAGIVMAVTVWIGLLHFQTAVDWILRSRLHVVLGIGSMLTHVVLMKFAFDILLEIRALSYVPILGGLGVWMAGGRRRANRLRDRNDVLLSISAQQDWRRPFGLIVALMVGYLVVELGVLGNPASMFQFLFWLAIYSIIVVGFVGFVLLLGSEIGVTLVVLDDALLVFGQDGLAANTIPWHRVRLSEADNDTIRIRTRWPPGGFECDLSTVQDPHTAIRTFRERTND
jgi:hypothetical protein